MTTHSVLDSMPPTFIILFAKKNNLISVFAIITNQGEKHCFAIKINQGKKQCFDVMFVKGLNIC